MITEIQLENKTQIEIITYNKEVITN